MLGRPTTVPESRRLGRAAVMAMLAVAETSGSGVLDSTFYPYTIEHLRRLAPPLIEIRCVCSRELAQARYRARSNSRHVGHLDEQRSPHELWNEHHLRPLGLGPVINVDTETTVDLAEVIDLVRRQAEVAGDQRR